MTDEQLKVKINSVNITGNILIVIKTCLSRPGRQSRSRKSSAEKRSRESRAEFQLRRSRKMFEPAEPSRKNFDVIIF